MAHCVDIRRERFSSTDRLLLDTNVALDIATPLAIAARDERRSNDYSTAIALAVAAGATISISVLSFFEIANVIERQTFRARSGAVPQGNDLKTFRRNAQARREVVSSIRTTWSELASVATIVEAGIVSGLPFNVLDAMHETLLDGYDPLIVDAARTTRSTLVTHDADFATVANLIVMTANPRML